MASHTFYGILVITTMVSFVTAQETPHFVQKPTDIIAAEGHAGTFNCIVGNFDIDRYEVQWYLLRPVVRDPYRRVTRKRSSTTQTWNNTTRRFYSTLTFSSITESDVGFYFCEVRSKTPGRSELLYFAAASLTLTEVQERLQCTRSKGQGDIIHLFKSGDTVSISCSMNRDTDTEQYWEVLHGAGKLDSRLHCVNCRGESKFRVLQVFPSFLRPKITHFLQLFILVCQSIVLWGMFDKLGILIHSSESFSCLLLCVVAIVRHTCTSTCS